MKTSIPLLPWLAAAPLLALLLPAASASAQPPALPTLSGPTARYTARLERVARRTLGCVMYDGDRGGEEYDDERCWDWYDRLESSRDPGVHATGRVLLAALADSAEGPEDSLPAGHARLVAILAGSQRASAAPYLLHVLAAARTDSPRDRALAVAAVEGLARVTGNDVAPLSPWQSPYEELAPAARRADALARWSAWYASHAAQSRREWDEEGLAQAAVALDHDDPVVRFAAMRRLASRGRAHHQIVASLRELVPRPELSSQARRYITRYATRHGLLRPDDVRELLREVTS